MAFGERYLRHMKSFWRGLPLRTDDVRTLALRHQQWLADELAQPFDGSTVVVTHSGPTKRSADPRYGLTPGTASFCNNDDALVALADVWIHGHLHCPHDYVVAHEHGSTRVVCNPRGYERLHESDGYTAHLVIDI
jgi:hypothetical protein